MVEGLVQLLITVLIVGLIAYGAVWLIRTAPFIAEPFKGVAIWIVYAIAVLVVVLKALPLIGVSI